ncbi:aldehyde dehydrogenase family protein [Sandaracinus amylolyticus]|uniref:aldehyde dehydrogenase family protein n=1 Tax=Sandaracinus amylolyticus TaxID=927083 RepID=UPI001F227F5B|nr:aldehyde dehydrogenase family protein [Sandaracinus amylolyticus]UJR81984.1 Coniferyl aldehyde dehydrogenase [Sandaracinus amylolyticus]
MDQSIDHEIQRVFSAQRARRWHVAQSSAADRIAKLRALKEAILSRRDELAAAVHKDFRKSKAEFELTEIHPVVDEINHAIEHLADWMKPESVTTPLVLAGAKSTIRYEARGVVLIVSPWNYPFNLLAAPLVGAIAAGNCVVLKPSSKTAHLAEAVAELIRSVFREDEVAIFTGSHQVADSLLALPFDHVLFTGSTNIGKKVMHAAADHLATITLELGGKSPVIIDRSADVEGAAKRIMWGKCVNAGQTCIAPDHAFVHRDVLDRFVAAARATVERFYGATEDARKKSDDFPRLIDDAAFRRVSTLLEKSLAMGAKAEFGGGTDASERYVAPTLLTNVRHDMPIMGEEIFGPILPVLPIGSVEEACTKIQAGDKPLALYLFASDREVIDQVFSSTTSGGAVLNDVFLHVANPYLPFGGVGASGMGHYHGHHGFKTFSHARAVVDRIASALPLFYPPYDEARPKVAAQLLRVLE